MKARCQEPISSLMRRARRILSVLFAQMKADGLSLSGSAALAVIKVETLKMRCCQTLQEFFSMAFRADSHTAGRSSVMVPDLPPSSIHYAPSPPLSRRLSSSMTTLIHNYQLSFLITSTQLQFEPSHCSR